MPPKKKLERSWSSRVPPLNIFPEIKVKEPQKEQGSIDEEFFIQFLDMRNLTYFCASIWLVSYLQSSSLKIQTISSISYNLKEQSRINLHLAQEISITTRHQPHAVYLTLDPYLETILRLCYAGYGSPPRFPNSDQESPLHCTPLSCSYCPPRQTKTGYR